MTLEIIILVILILLSGFFSGAEVALLSIPLVRVRLMRKQKRRGADSLLRLKSHPRKMIITILIGNNVVNIVAASMATYIASERFGSTGIGIATGVLTIIILVIGEITPKSFSQAYASKIAPRIARPVELLSILLYPLVYVLDKQTHFIEKLVRIKKYDPISEAEIKEMIAFGVEKKVVHAQERLIINRALEFADTQTKEIMIPLSKAFALPAHKKIIEVVDQVISFGFSRIPVYEGSRTNVVGIVLVKDILHEVSVNRGKKSLKELLIPPFFVRDTLGIHQLLREFKKKSLHLAVVRNAKESIIGIVTLEDLLEELVGEIEDETDVRN